jgi:hypothetical protein
VARASYVAELESNARSGLQGRMIFENLMEGCQKEIELLLQHINESERGFQVSKAGFSFNQIRIIYFCSAFLKERMIL